MFYSSVFLLFSASVSLVLSVPFSVSLSLSLFSFPDSCSVFGFLEVPLLLKTLPLFFGLRGFSGFDCLFFIISLHSSQSFMCFFRSVGHFLTAPQGAMYPLPCLPCLCCLRDISVGNVRTSSCLFSSVQSSHLSFKSWCLRTCCHKESLFAKIFFHPRQVQTKPFAKSCTLMCFSTCEGNWNFLLQTEQACINSKCLWVCLNIAS